MYSSLVCYFLLLFLPTIISFDDYDNDDERQMASHSILPKSERINHLSSSLFDTLTSLNTTYHSSDQTINLHDLGITSIDADTFQNYPLPIATIILSSNSLSFLPNHLFKPWRTSLINLNLQHNQFSSLTKIHSLRYLDRLRTLDLSKNRIDELFPDDFLGLQRLDTLILRENQLTYLSNGLFRHCRKLTTLDLSDNHISTLDPQTFSFLTQLKNLLFSNNLLREYSVTNSLLKPLRSLEYLDLENTELQTLAPFTFVYNRRLQSIKLRHNHFHENSTVGTLKQAFCGARSLVEIDLVNTSIHSLDLCSYQQIPSLRRLYLMNNPLDCTCDLFYLKYGDVYRVLLVDGTGLDQTQANVDIHLNRWISRPELRRHLEKAYRHGDFRHLPIELSFLARCESPPQWKGYEIDNITAGIYSQCHDRWSVIEEQCRDYCHVHSLRTVVTSSASIFRTFQFLFFFFSLFVTGEISYQT